MSNKRSVKGTVEYRAIPLGDTQAEDGKLRGVAIRFNSPTQIGDPAWGFRERFAPGSLTKTLQERDVVLLDNHDQAKPIARKSAGTLRTYVSDGELRWDADPVDTSYARDAAANIKAKNYGGCSVGFRAIKEEWLDDDGNPSDSLNGTQRVIREAELPEFSVATFPAYGDTEVSARDMVSAAREARASKEPYGDVEYADPGYQKDGKKRYPIDTHDHVKAAWSYINQQDNASKYSAEDLAKVKSAIKSAAKKFGIEINDEDSAVLDTESRDDPDGKEFAAIDAAIDLLEAEKPDPDGALKVLLACRPGRNAVIPKPGSSTSEIDIRSYRLRMMKLQSEV